MTWWVESTAESFQKLKTSVSFLSSCETENLIILYDQQYKIQPGFAQMEIIFQKPNKNRYWMLLFPDTSSLR
jgi:hypothetical protein